MRFRCPFCFYAINTDESARGYSMTCPSCAKTVMVPVGRFEDGCIIGDFLIKSKIGEGSIGAVYLATQLSLERQVALKILSPEYSTQKGINDFLNEARAAAKLSHINLVQSFAAGAGGGAAEACAGGGESGEYCLERFPVPVVCRAGV